MMTSVMTHTGVDNNKNYWHIFLMFQYYFGRVTDRYISLTDAMKVF